jgi:hypothetical protein
LGISFNFSEEANYDHVVTAALIIVYFAFLGHPTLGLAVALVFAGVKEFLFDHYFEDPVTRGSDLEDFLWYLVGIGFGEVLVFAKRLF